MLTLVLAIIALFTVRFVTTTIHELGHAVPALLFTQSPVNIYVGSYGDPAKSWVLRWGRLTAYFRSDLTQWNMGMCSHAATTTLAQTLLVILGGPLASLLLGLTLLLYLLRYESTEETIFLLTIFILSAVLDFIVNLFPSSQPAQLYDGSLLYNDGYQLLYVWGIGRLPDAYFKGVEKLEEKDFTHAQRHFQSLIDQGIHQREVYRKLAEAYRGLADREAVLHTFADLAAHHKLEPGDLQEVGQVYLEKGAYREAIQAFSQSLYRVFADPQTLFRRGLAYVQLGEYEKAALDFQTCISYRADYPAAYRYWGLAFIRLGRGAEALQMLRKAAALGDESPELFLHFGFYYTSQNENRLALENYLEAERRGLEHYGLAFYIEEAKQALQDQAPETAEEQGGKAPPSKD